MLAFSRTGAAAVLLAILLSSTAPARGYVTSVRLTESFRSPAPAEGSLGSEKSAICVDPSTGDVLYMFRRQPRLYNMSFSNVSGWDTSNYFSVNTTGSPIPDSPNYCRFSDDAAQLFVSYYEPDAFSVFEKLLLNRTATFASGQQTRGFAWDTASGGYPWARIAVRNVVKVLNVETLEFNASRDSPILSSDTSRINDLQDVAVDSQGRVWVTLESSNQVVVFSESPANGYREVMRIGNTEGGSGPIQFRSPSGIAIDSYGFVYVADTNNHRISIFNSFGIYTGQLGVTGDEGNSNDAQYVAFPSGLAIHGSELYVVENAYRRFRRFSIAPVDVKNVTVSFVAESSPAKLSGGSSDICSAPDSDTIYVTDYSGPWVRVFFKENLTLADNAFFRDFSAANRPRTCLVHPSETSVFIGYRSHSVLEEIAPAFDNRSMPLANYSIGSPVLRLKWDKTRSGSFPSLLALASSKDKLIAVNLQLRDLNATSLNGLLGVEDFAIDSRRRIWLVDSILNQVVVYQLTSDGSLQNELFRVGCSNNSSCAAELSIPLCVAIDMYDIVYICDSNNHNNNSRVSIFSASGTWLGQIGETGSTSSPFKKPVAITTEGASLFVLDEDRKTVSHFLIGAANLSDSPTTGGAVPATGGVSSLIITSGGSALSTATVTSAPQLATAAQWGLTTAPVEATSSTTATAATATTMTEHIAASSTSGSGSLIWLVVAGSAAGMLTLVVGALLLVRYRRRSAKGSLSGNEVASADEFSTQEGPSFSSALNEDAQSGRHATPEVSAIKTIDGVQRGQKLGQGAFGFVYKGDWGGTPVALKTVSDDDEKARRDLLQEASLMQSLNHPNICRLLGLCEIGGVEYLAFEFMKLGSVSDLLAKVSQPLPLDRKLDMLVQAARGLVYLAKNGVVHRDVAARNLLCDDSKTAVSDFGMSRNAVDGIYSARAGAAVPVRWSSPEVLKQGKASLASDVYSFGVTIVEVCRDGVLPFISLTNAEVTEVVIAGRHLEHLQLPQSFPPKLQDIVDRCCQAAISDRPAMSEVLTNLEDLQDLGVYSSDASLEDIDNHYQSGRDNVQSGEYSTPINANSLA